MSRAWEVGLEPVLVYSLLQAVSQPHAGLLPAQLCAGTGIFYYFVLQSLLFTPQ